jgi:hypothetical protein
LSLLVSRETRPSSFGVSKKVGRAADTSPTYL